jgi:hypothetical protein
MKRRMFKPFMLALGALSLVVVSCKKDEVKPTDDHDHHHNDSELSNDSYLQQLGAQSLREATQARIAREIERNTIGAINLDTLTNPFNATLLATGQEPFIYRDYTITKPDGLLDYAAFFLQKLTGTYFPASPIEGSYFSDVELLRLRPLQAIGNLGGGNIVNRPNPSIKFLQNTGAGTRSVLFNALNYNRYKPDYALTSTQVGNAINNLFDNFTSIGNLYVGKQETDISFFAHNFFVKSTCNFRHVTKGTFGVFPIQTLLKRSRLLLGSRN